MAFNLFGSIAMKYGWVLGCLALVACATSPTGRKQLILVSDAQMVEMGITSFQQMKQSQQISHDQEVNQYVQCVSQAVIKGLPLKWQQISWEVVVFEEPSANAFALPGGKIGVHTGLLAVAETPAQLAAVIGHEVGHVISSHGAARVSQQLATEMGLSVADAMVKQKINGSTERDLLMAGLGLGTQLGILLPYSRNDEREADILGMDFMANAGFDPEQNIVLWQNMAKAAGDNKQPQFLSTHPLPESRIQLLQKRLPLAVPLFQKSQHSPDCHL